MGERMQLPLEEIKLAFAASCVEGATNMLYFCNSQEKAEK